MPSKSKTCNSLSPHDSPPQEPHDTPKTESLCFHPVSTAYHSSRIPWHQYLHHLLSHFTGTLHTLPTSPHPDDNSPLNNWSLLHSDPFAYSLQCYWRRNISVTLSPTLFTDLIPAAIEGNVQRLKSRLEEFPKTYPELEGLPLIPLTILALQNRRSEALAVLLNHEQVNAQGCLAKGPPAENTIINTAVDVYGTEDPDSASRETLKVLEESKLGGACGKAVEHRRKKREKEKMGGPKMNPDGRGYAPEQIAEWFDDVPW